MWRLVVRVSQMGVSFEPSSSSGSARRFFFSALAAFSFEAFFMCASRALEALRLCGKIRIRR